MRHLRTSASLILLNLIILIACSANFENEKNINKYDALIIKNKNLNDKIETLENDLKNKDNQMQVLKENAACLLALEPLREYFSEEELLSLIEEIPKGNPFITDFLVTASFGESTGFFPREKHGGIDIIPRHPENMQWEIYPTADGFVVHSGWDPIHGKNILIQNSDRIRTRFSHLNKYYYVALPGREVTTETHIGDMGNTGYSLRAHLHYEIWVKVAKDKWIKIDPRSFLERGR